MSATSTPVDFGAKSPSLNCYKSVGLLEALQPPHEPTSRSLASFALVIGSTFVQRVMCRASRPSLRIIGVQTS
jgi:hypothetical protein